MLGSAVLDTVIGLSFVFFLVAVLASAVAEWVANLLRKRAKFLLRGLAAMLGEDQGARPRFPWPPSRYLQGEHELYRSVLRPTVGAAAGVNVAALMAHPLLRAHRQTDPDGRYTRLPAYLPAPDVAAALIDVVLDDPSTGEIGGRIAALGPSSLGRALRSLWESSGGDRARFVEGIERWYDAQMERVSGWYKRWAKRWIIAIGLFVAMGLNVDAGAIGVALYRDDTVREIVVAAAEAGSLCTAEEGTDGEGLADCTRRELESLGVSGLPIGYPPGCPVDPVRCVGGDAGPGDWLAKLAGVVLTAIAAAVGAPFWFDALSRLGSLRNTGNRPKGTTPPVAPPV